MSLFIKKIPKKSMEYKILKEIEENIKFNPIFLPIQKEKVEKNTKLVKIYWKKYPYTIQTLISLGIWERNEKEWNAWKQISHSLSFLHSLGILHFDVHLDNILCNKKKTEFYLIDFGISKKIKSNYEKYYLSWKEDEFQLLWNFIFQSNKYPNDYSILRKKIQKENKRKQNLLKKELLFCLPKDYIEKSYILFLDKDPIQIKVKIEQIKFKLFLERVYLLYFIFLEKPNLFYQKMFHSLDWKLEVKI